MSLSLLIIEDEKEAAERLVRMLKEIDSSIKICGQTDSISSTLKWLNENELPDAILSDIQLADGDSFEIFRERKIEVPVIFTTAYNQYALNAFKLLSVDYLLKPIKKQELENSLQKLKDHYITKQTSPELYYRKLADLLAGKEETSAPKRIVTKIGQHIKAIDIHDVAYFFTENKIAYLSTADNPKIPVDHTLDELENMFQNAGFFRINRQFIVHIRAIKKMVSLGKGRVQLTLEPATKLETIVSSERATEFKKWLSGG